MPDLNPVPPDPYVTAWCSLAASIFREGEDCEAPPSPSGERDAALVKWVIRVLSNPGNTGTAEVLEAIDRQRAVTS